MNQLTLLRTCKTSDVSFQGLVLFKSDPKLMFNKKKTLLIKSCNLQRTFSQETVNENKRTHTF